MPNRGFRRRDLLPAFRAAAGRGDAQVITAVPAEAARVAMAHAPRAGERVQRGSEQKQGDEPMRDSCGRVRTVRPIRPGRQNPRSVLSHAEAKYLEASPA